MSVIVKGMEMPTTCRECVIGNPKAKTCIIGKPKMNTKRRDDCPLVEIPPHSDLVDRDDLIAEYDHQHKGPAGGARQIMVDAKAVIKADGYQRQWVDWQTKGKG